MKSPRSSLLALGTSLLAILPLGLVGCGEDSTGPLGDVDAIVFLQRAKRNETGDIFQYTSYAPGARIVKLSPPTADGKLETLCCTSVAGF